MLVKYLQLSSLRRTQVKLTSRVCQFGVVTWNAPHNDSKSNPIEFGNHTCRSPIPNPLQLDTFEILNNIPNIHIFIYADNTAIISHYKYPDVTHSRLREGQSTMDRRKSKTQKNCKPSTSLEYCQYSTSTMKDNNGTVPSTRPDWTQILIHTLLETSS